MGCSCTKVTPGPDIREHYKIGAVLGSGSFGQVRVSIRRKDNKPFAVKIMSKDPPREKRGSNNVDFVLMFRNEVSLLRTLDHPNVIRMYEAYEDKSFLYALMDRCDGGELFSYIVKNRRIPEKQAVSLCRQMLDAISYIHQSGVVHRDIKAENFLFRSKSPDSPLVLIDFGMSIRVLEEDRSLKQLCGSPHYVAPELIRRNYRFKVDMWALGVVVFLMLYGKYPFEGNDQKAIVQAVLNNQPDYARSGAPASDLAIDFLKHLLEKNPTLRLNPAEALQHPWLLGTMATEGNNNQIIFDSRNQSPSNERNALSVPDFASIPPQQSADGRADLGAVEFVVAT